MDGWNHRDGLFVRRITIGERKIDQIISFRPDTPHSRAHGHWAFSCWHGLDHLREPVFEHHTLESACAAADQWLEKERTNAREPQAAQR